MLPKHVSAAILMKPHNPDNPPCFTLSGCVSVTKTCASTAEGAHLLGCLIHSAPRLVMPYVGPILKALVSKLRSASIPLIIHPSPQVTHMQKGSVQGGGETGVMASVLATTGELARVAGSNLRPHIGDILPLIIEAIGHPSGANKSVVAVVTLGQVSITLCTGSAMHCSHAIGMPTLCLMYQLMTMLCFLLPCLLHCLPSSSPWVTLAGFESKAWSQSCLIGGDILHDQSMQWFNHKTTGAFPSPIQQCV